MSDSENSKKCLLSFKPISDWYDAGQRLYSRTAKVELYANDVKCFIGCNGAGKSTLLEQIEDKLRKQNFIEVKDVSNPFYNILEKKKDKYNGFIVHFDADFEVFESVEAHAFDFLNDMSSSTGEALFNKFCNAASAIGRITRKAKEMNVPLILLWDDCDVGTSIDVQDEILNFLTFVKNEMIKENIEYSIVLTANSYELCKTFDCYDCNTLKQVKFNTYDKYKKFVLASRKRKDARTKSNS